MSRVADIVIAKISPQEAVISTEAGSTVDSKWASGVEVYHSLVFEGKFLPNVLQTAPKAEIDVEGQILAGQCSISSGQRGAGVVQRAVFHLLA